MNKCNTGLISKMFPMNFDDEFMLRPLSCDDIDKGQFLFLHVFCQPVALITY